VLVLVLVIVIVIDDQRFDYDYDHEQEHEKKAAGRYGLSRLAYQLTSASPKKSQINPPSAR
jgi:hypothetical protein